MARAALALGGTDTGRADPPASEERSAASGKNAERSADPAARPDEPFTGADPDTGAELGADLVTDAEPETGAAELGADLVTDAEPDTGAELGADAEPETGAAELRTGAEPETGAELGTGADPETGFAAPDDAHRAPAAGGGGSSYP